MLTKNDFTYRTLTTEDSESYLDLYNSSDELMSMNKKEIGHTESMAITVLSNPNALVVGAFDANNTLIASAFGLFSTKLPYWYAMRTLFRTPDNSLAMYKLSINIFKECMNMIISHAESKEYFAFYSRRTVKQQTAFEHMAIRSGETQSNRYDLYHEMVYPKGSNCKFAVHEPYFGNLKSYPVDTVISFSVLKQEERKKLLDSTYRCY
jgi:hypothetical protein